MDLRSCEEFYSSIVFLCVDVMNFYSLFYCENNYTKLCVVLLQYMISTLTYTLIKASHAMPAYVLFYCIAITSAA